MMLLLPGVSQVGITLPSSFIPIAPNPNPYHHPCAFSSIITPTTTTTSTSFEVFELNAKIKDDDENDDEYDGGGDGVGRVNETKTTSIRNVIKRDRIIRQLGLVIGILLMLSAIGLGIVARLIDPMLVGISSVLIIIIGKIYTESYNEYCSPMPDSCFCVKESTINNAGLGLFATTFFEEGTYLMKYEGEIFSNEDQYFDRYPNGDGKYVAEIQRALFQSPVYIDGVDPSKSNLARYMNSAMSHHPQKLSSTDNDDGNINTAAASKTANVIWKKQRYGKQAGSMYFYTLRNILDGEELLFDYGADYWNVFAEMDSN